MVSGMLEIRSDHDGVCQGCASKKQVKGPFPSSKSRTSQVLHLAHSDLCRPMPITSLDGYLYYIIFVDDFSRKTWIYFLKNKSQTFNMFKDYKALVEKQIGKQIKIFRSITSKLLADYSSILEEDDQPTHRNITPKAINTAQPWAYFDGSAQETGCGGGGLYFICLKHMSIKFKWDWERVQTTLLSSQRPKTSFYLNCPKTAFIYSYLETQKSYVTG